jgi:hypothetical protein
MKKVSIVLGTIMLATALLTSCGGNSIESDAKKVAELQCKAQQLALKAASGDMSILEESTKLSTEAAALVGEMENKYSSESDKQKFGEAILKEMSNCK